MYFSKMIHQCRQYIPMCPLKWAKTGFRAFVNIKDPFPHELQKMLLFRQWEWNNTRLLYPVKSCNTQG